MTEMDLLARFRAEVPARVSPKAERRFHTALHTALHSERTFPSLPAYPASPHRRLPLSRVALAAGLAAAAAAAVIVAVPHSPAGRPAAGRPASAAAALPTVQELAYRASAAALAAKPVSPGQWVYEKSTVTTIAPKGGHGKSATTQTWQTADGLRSAWYYRGQLDVEATPAEGKDIGYAELTKLPPSPQALVRYIYERERQILGPEPANLTWQMTFNEIAGLFNHFVLPPRVAAALFRALPYIPGVRAVRQAGSVAFIRSEGNLDAEKVILSPSTYTVTGTVLADPADGVIKQFTFIARIPVSGPGVRP